MTARKRAPAKRSAASEPSLQEDVRALKMERILKVASKLFVEKGFVGTTMDAIAEQLSMTKPFIYQFFQNKHSVLVAICGRELRESLAMLNDVATGSGPASDRLASFVRVATRRNIENRGLWTLMAAEERHLPKEMLSEIRSLELQFHKRLTAIIEDGVKSGEFVNQNPQLASRAVMGMTQWVRRWYRPGETTPEQVVDEFCALSLRMLGFA